jgi:hypothetical protein
MAYPLVLAPNGEEIMRINHNGSLSVLWDRVLHHRYQPEAPTNVVVIRVCEVVLAARDNFLQTAWAESNEWHDKWPHFMVHIDYSEKVPSRGRPFFTITNGFLDLIAAINKDGKWSIDWPRVAEVALLPIESPNVVTVIGFCRLLMAAQYRFRTVPWKLISLFGDDEDEEDDDC